jgi:endonuclease/exonuclease/phosphatase family metal-dependent hydrolase
MTKFHTFLTIILGLASLTSASLSASAQTPSEIVLYAAQAPVKTGNWLVVNDAGAAGGSSLLNANANLPKASAPSANPAHFFEMNFRAEAGTAYHIWIRAKAQNNSAYNDSVYVQFSGSVSASTGLPVYRIGTKSAAMINLEDCSGCGLSGWGWQDNGWGTMGRDLYFATSGPQTIRFQTREDGLSIDQIVLSAQTYVSVPPGTTKNSATILAANDGSLPNRPPQVVITAQAVSNTRSQTASAVLGSGGTTSVEGVAPLTVNFIADAVDPDGAVIAYNWDFGDGQSSDVVSPSHTFQAAGSYTVRLTVTDNFGSTASDAVVVTVTPPVGGASLKVLSWNIEKGRGTDEITSLDRTATWIAQLDPDVAALCEVMRTSSNNQPQKLLELLRVKTGVTWYGYWYAKYSGDDEGNFILSKIPFNSTGGMYLRYQRSVAWASITFNSRTINLFATHLDNESATYRQTQVNQLEDYLSTFGETKIVAGDFNATRTTAEMTDIKSDYYDAWELAVGAQTARAYPDNPVGLSTRTRRARIDYIFFSRNSSNLKVKSATVPDSRDLSNTNVVNKLGTTDDKGVRPSDHNHTLVTFEVN